jgi:HEAT repeat protein
VTLVLLCSLPCGASAYIDATMNLGQIVGQSSHISVLEVDRAVPAKQTILFKTVAVLKGKPTEQPVKHLLSRMNHPDATEFALDWAEPGATAIAFGSDKTTLICMGKFWYQCQEQQNGWWLMSRGRPELSLAYFGSAEKLRRHVVAMLEKKQVMVTAVQHGGQVYAYEALAHKEMLLGRPSSIWRVKASLAMQGSVQIDGTPTLTLPPNYVVGLGAGVAEDVPPLVESLQKGADRARREAAEELGWIGPPAKAALGALTEALQDPDGLLRVRAASAIAAIDPQHPAYLPALAGALKEQDGRVRKAAIRALGDIGPEAKGAVPALVAIVQGDSDLRPAAIETLGRIGPDARAAVGQLIEALKDPGVKAVASTALGRIGPAARTAIPALAEELQRTADVNLPAARALARIGGPDAARAVVPYLVRLLDKADPEQRWDTIYILGTMGPDARDAVPALVKLAEGGHPSAGVALVQIDLRAAVPYLPRSAFWDKGVKIKEILPRLQRGLHDPDAGVRCMAAWGLWKFERIKGPDAVAVMVAALDKANDPAARQAAAMYLGQLGPVAKDAIADLRAAAAQDANPRLQKAAAEALNQIGAK